MYLVLTSYIRCDETMYSKMYDDHGIMRNPICAFCLPNHAKAIDIIRKYGDELRIELITFPSLPNYATEEETVDDAA